MNVVAIGAHPDDIEIGVGGTVALHREKGDNVSFIVLTKGEKLSDPDQRKREAEEAAELLDVDDVTFLEYEDTKVPYDADIIERIEAELDRIQPRRAYIHAEEDTHQDHRHASLASVTATRRTPEVLAFESPSTRSSFNPQYYSAFSEGPLEQKIEAIRTHESQREKKYLEAEAMKGLARFRGRQANTRFAEALQVMRITSTRNGLEELRDEH